MDKSPLNTLTLEDYIESERHKLFGTFTPVTPETFAKWKQERKDKKLAEEEAKQAKEATGRAMFESGNWANDDSDDDDDGPNGIEWDLARMRLETEQARADNEVARLAVTGDTEADSLNGDDT